MVGSPNGLDATKQQMLYLPKLLKKEL